MADQTHLSLTAGKENVSKGRPRTSSGEANGSSAATVHVLRSRGESPLIITAPCGKITTRGTCSRFGLEPVHLTFGPDGKKQASAVRSTLKRRPSSPLEDVAKHLVDRSARKRQFSGPVTPMNARGLFTGNWTRQDESELFNKDGEHVPLPLCSPLPVGRERWQLLPVSGAQQRFPPTPSARSKMCTPMSARKLKACRQLKLRESQELQDKLKAQVLKGLAMERREKTYRAWLNSLLLPSSAGKVLDLQELFISAASGVCKDKPRVHLKQDDTTAAATTEKLGKLSSVKCRIARRKVGPSRKGKGKSHLASLEVHLKPICAVPELRRRLELGPLDRSKQEEIVSTMLQLAKHVDEGRLRMKQGCPLVADIALREKALQVVMSYNPAWLRLGLLAVLGPNVMNTLGVCEQDAYTEVFLERHFLGDVCLAKTYATNKSIEGLYRDGYHDCLGRLILKRVLLLVLYLDRLKCETATQSANMVDGLDGGSPPLFRPNCTVKSSRQALCEFFSDSLCGEGNFLGHLGILGYHVLYVQTPLVEYNFEVTDMAKDLQDGIRLSRVAQLLSNDPALLNKMQFSSLTSTKLENCEAALTCLAEAGVSIEDHEGFIITPQDILSGGREKILSLLWNVILRLQLPALINSRKLWEEILRIQSIQDSNHSLSGRFLSQLDLLLCWVEAICSQHGLPVTDFGASFADGRALCYVVNFYLPEKFPLQEIHDGSSEEVIIRQQQCDDTPGCDGDVFSVTLCRGAATRNFRFLRAVARKFTSIPEDLFGEDTLEGDACIHEHSVIIFLAFLCSELLCRETLLKVKEQDGTASTWHAELVSQRIARLQELDTSRAALRIQTWYRTAKQRIAYKTMKAKVVLIQDMVRAWLERKHSASICRMTDEQALHLQVERKVIIVQALFRQWMQRRTLTISLAHIRTIQRTWRAKVARKKFLEMRSAALRIQRAWKACYISNLRLRSTTSFVVRIQAWWRGALVRILVGRMETAVTMISKNYRAYVQQRSYRNLRTLVLRLQAFAKGKLIRKRFSEYKEAARRIQYCYRYWTTKRRKTSEATDILVGESKAARRIQRAWRIYRSRQLQHEAAVQIQSAYRTHIQRKTYLDCRSRIIKIQSLVRSRIIRRNNQDYHRSAQKIQHAFRQWIIRGVSLRTKASLVIQSSWRSYWSRKMQLRAALNIQRAFRSWSHRKKTSAAIKLQAAIRGFIARKNVRMWEQAASLIQTSFRNFVARLNCEKAERTAATKIQLCWRGYVAARYLISEGKTHKRNTESTFDLETEKKALQVIRDAMQTRQERKCFLSTRKSAVTIQRWCRFHFTAKVNAVVTLQRYFRGWKARHSFRKTRRAVILVQAHWKGYQHRQRQNFLNIQMLELRARMKVTADNVENSMRLGNRLMEALANLLSKKTVSSILNTCATIDYATQHSQFCCERLVEGGAIVKLIQLIQTTNRSPPHELVLKHALSILGNLARFPGIAKQLANSTHFMTIITEQLHMFRHKDEVFRIAWHVFRLVCTVAVGADLLERSPSVFRRLHLVAQNLERRIDVEKRSLERLPLTATAMTRKAGERRTREVTGQYHTLVSLINQIRKEVESRERHPLEADCKVKYSPANELQRPHFPRDRRTKASHSGNNRSPLMDRSNL